MTAIIAPLAAASLIFLLGAAATGVFRRAGNEAEVFGPKATFQLLLLPVCLAVIIFIVDGLANHLYWAPFLRP